MPRTSAPATPVRQSQRLREKAAESHNLEEEKKAHDMDLETHKKGIMDIVEHRRSPARTRSSTKEAELVTPETPSQSSREDKESDNLSVVQTPTRTLRPRTPSRSRQNDVPIVSTTRTPRRSRRLSETSTASEATITTGTARKSPSRATRSRKVSTSEDEPVTSTRKSPSRRTPTRSMSATKQAKETANVKTKSFGRAAKALQQKFDTINPLGEMDARSYFDNAMAKKSIEPGGSRRRTRSDSEIPDIKSKKSKTLNIEETIEEVEEETATGKK
ncbi:hypothetical protein NECAME_02040 [Necator americanus]|uniref:Uncharacterized protein n=1 Tax=Necator americanus TaxID=51031 RepID=W2TKL2_NECAM|nr:hypothetical protein NECAME_02040 [Necator americanus]ETN82303.1 hypothetical protein NECAME_02040 [Necator americanus]